MSSRYYFNLTDGDQIIRDQDGLTLADIDAAITYAITAIEELRAEASVCSDEWQGWRMEILNWSGEVDEDGRILDGHHRAAIAAELGIACPSRTIVGLDEAGKRKYAITVNLMRRQLDRTARGALVAQLRTEGLSVRRIAEATGINRETVRRDLAGDTSVSPERVVGADGRSYRAVAPPREALAGESAPLPLVDPADGHRRAVPSLRTPTPSTPNPPALEGARQQSSEPALPWPVAEDSRPRAVEDDTAHAARVSSDVRQLITLAQMFSSPELRAQAVALYADHLGNAPMPPFGEVNADELDKAADAIRALAKDWRSKR